MRGLARNFRGERSRRQALRAALLGAIADGECTRDIKGKLSTTEFTRVVGERLRSALR